MRKCYFISQDDSGKLLVCIDSENENKLLGVIKKSSHFKEVHKLLLDYLIDTTLIKKVYIESDFAIKLFLYDNPSNPTFIYCKEQLWRGNKIIILVDTVTTKDIKLSLKEFELVKKIVSYEYYLET